MKYVFLIFICFILFNCGKKKEEVADENESVNRTFDGTYSTSCFSKDSNYQKVTLTISGKDLSVYWRNYKNNSCSSNSLFSGIDNHSFFISTRSSFFRRSSIFAYCGLNLKISFIILYTPPL